MALLTRFLARFKSIYRSFGIANSPKSRNCATFALSFAVFGGNSNGCNCKE
jgi:hypothetical protein